MFFYLIYNTIEIAVFLVSQFQNINETNIEFIFYPSISIRINNR
jgi:hypothetical protein